MKVPYPTLFVLLLVATLPACSKKEGAAASVAGGPHRHEHKTPHGGTPIVLGEEAYHLELVRDPVAGRLTLYVLDGEMENFVRIAAAQVDVAVTIADKSETLVFLPVANAATGEKEGETSQFEATAEWLKTTTTFDGFVIKIEIRGTSFSSVMFSFPKGNDRD